MNWFLIFYTAGKVSGMLGPFPEEAACHRTETGIQTSITLMAQTGVTKKGRRLNANEKQSVKRLSAKCEQRTTKPTYGETNV